MMVAAVKISFEFPVSSFESEVGFFGDNAVA